MSARFTGKVMVITGAAQGIGRRVAERAAAEGARLVLADLADYVHELAAELTQQGAETLAVQADLETWDGAETLMTKAHERFGRIDVLVNNVGGTIWAQPYEHYSPEQIQKEIQRSLFPTLWCCRAVLPHMVAQQGGAIVNVSSVATRGLMRVPYGAGADQPGRTEQPHDPGHDHQQRRREQRHRLHAPHRHAPSGIVTSSTGACARSCAITAATARSILRGEFLVSLASRDPR